MGKAPRVSVVMATYNHASYVAQAIRSVLDQTFPDLELLVGDDGSSDSTAEIVGRGVDPRLVFFPSAVNRGACVVMNELIARAAGEYVAVLNSDDYWARDKLAHQVDFLDRNPGYAALFARVAFVDGDGRSIPKSGLSFGKVFDQENRSRGRWLRRFFDTGNCLCHPSVLIRRACYAELGPYDSRYRQLPDWDMWVRLAKRYELFVSDRELVSMRVLPGENVSSLVGENLMRTLNEHFLVGMGLFDGMSRELLLDGFGDLLRIKEPPTEIHCDIEKALLYFARTELASDMYKLLGLSRLFQLLGTERHRSVLESDYGMDDRGFQGLCAEVDLFRPMADLRRTDGSVLAQELMRRAGVWLGFRA